MNLMFSLLLPVLKSLVPRVHYDVSFGPFIAIGIAVILVVGAGIIFLIVLAVKFLIRIRNKKTKDD